MAETFKFIEVLKDDNFFFKFLTRYGGLNSLRNMNFLLNSTKEFIVDFDNPEITSKDIFLNFNNYIVVQDGKKIDRIEEFNPTVETIALSPHNNNKYYEVFLCRATAA